MKKQNGLGKKILFSLLAAGVMTTCAAGSASAVYVGAIYSDTVWSSNSVTIENKSYNGDYLCNVYLGKGADISNAKFANNKISSTSNDVRGQIYLIGTADPANTHVNIKDSVFESNVSQTSADHGWALGGAVMLKGSTSTFTDVVFTNNKFISTGTDTQTGGGAIYVDAVINSNVTKPAGNVSLKIIATKDLTYTGNTVESKAGGAVWYDTWGNLVQSKGGFLFIDRNAVVDFDVADKATLTIGERGASDKNADTIASGIPVAGGNVDFAVINKTGAGNLVINSSLNDYYGEMYVKEGSLTAGSDWNLHNKLDVATGAEVTAEDITVDSVTGSWTARTGNNNATATYTVKGATGSITTAAGSTLTAKDITVKAGSVNAAGTVTVDNVIANKDTTVSFTGGATINKDLKADGGAITLAGDTLQVYKVGGKIITSNNGTVALAGGTLEDDAIASKIEGTLELKDSGILSTKSNQIYTYAASETAKDSGAIKTENIKYTGGTLKLTDEKYTLDYSSKAKAALKEKGATTLVMSGQLVTEQGEIKSEIGVDNAANVGDEVQLDQVKAKAEENLLVGTIDNSASQKPIDGVAVKEQVASGFAVASLELPAAKNADTTVGVVITNAQNVTLGGSAGGDVITVKGDTETSKTDVKVVIGTNEKVAGTDTTVGALTIGNKLATADTKYTLNGEAVINAGSKLNVNGQTEITKSVTLNGATVAINDGAKLTTETLVVGVTEGTEAAKESSSVLTGAADVKTVTIGEKSVLNVGSSEKAGELKVDSITGGMVFLDPAWSIGDTISKASGLSIGKDTEDDTVTIQTALVAGNNSKISVGAELSAADVAFAKTGLTWGSDVNAAAYIGKPATLGSNGSLTLDGSITDKNFKEKVKDNPAEGTLTLAANSILMVDGTKVQETAAISGVTTLSIDKDAKLFVDNAEKGKTYKILAGGDGVKNGTKWTAANIFADNNLLTFVRSGDEAGNYNLLSQVQKLSDAYGDGAIIAPNVFDTAIGKGNNALEDFAMDAAKTSVNGTTVAQAVAYNSEAALSEMAGSARGAYTAAGLVNGAVADHMSLVHEYTHDKDVWAKYIHNKEDVDGLSIAGFGVAYKNQYNGIVVGADLYHNEKATVGVALTYGDGDISGSTLSAYTKNDTKYYGATIYGGIHNGDTAFLGDISYLHSKNDITQQNSGKTITGSETGNAFSIGVRAEQSVKAGHGQFVPYVGLRYMHLSNGSYTDSLGMSHDGGDMNLWLLPVGVKYSVDAKHGSWTLRPVAEIGYVWNMGDRDARETVSFDGTTNSFGYDVTDNGSYLGHLGFEAEKGNTRVPVPERRQRSVQPLDR